MGFKRQIKKMVFDNMTMADVFSTCDIMDNFFKRFSESSDIDDVLDEISQSDMENVAYLVAILEALVRHKDEKRYKEIKQAMLCSFVSDDLSGNWGKDEWRKDNAIKYSDSVIDDIDDSDYIDDFANPDDYGGDIDLMGDPIGEENPFSNQSKNGVCLDAVTINCDLRDTDGTNLCGDIPNIMNEDTEDLTSLSSVIEDGD